MSQYLAAAALLTLVTVFDSPAFAQAQDVQAIVDQFYPTAALVPDDQAARRSCFAVLQVDAEGEAVTIVAGYTDLWMAAVRILTRTGAVGYEVASETPPNATLMGTACGITLVDVNSDGQPEIYLELSSHKGSNAWIYRWANSKLSNLTPTYVAGPAMLSQLGSSTRLVDLNHDGLLEIVVSGGREGAGSGLRRKDPDKIYVLGSGGYVPDSVVLRLMKFWPGDGLARYRSFRLVAGSTGPYVLRIVNGDRLGQRRATGGVILINGTPVSSQNQITGQTEFL